LCAGCSGGFVLANIADESKAFAWQRLDQSLPVAAIADGAAGRVDAVEQSRVRNDPPMPDRSQQLILADHAVTVANQMNEEIEDLRLDGHRRGSPA
jgi:hypothetical protein